MLSEKNWNGNYCFYYSIFFIQVLVKVLIFTTMRSVLGYSCYL